MILYSDADVWYNASASDILQCGEVLGDRVLFAGERHCWPFVDESGAEALPGGTSTCKQYPEPLDRGPRRYLNSGQFLGSFGAVRRVLQQWGSVCGLQKLWKSMTTNI